MNTVDLVGIVVGMALTLLMFSYILGDNPLYRLALYILIGATVGYAFAVTVVTVLTPEIISLIEGNVSEVALPMMLGIFLLFKAAPRLATLGNFSTAFLIGVGAAVAVAGTLLGTVIPQATATGSIADWIRDGQLINGLLVAAGTVLSLLAFTFVVPQGEQHGLRGAGASLFDAARAVGRLFLVIGFGAAFAGALVASLTVLIGRIHALRDGIALLIHFFGS